MTENESGLNPDTIFLTAFPGEITPTRAIAHVIDTLNFLDIRYKDHNDGSISATRSFKRKTVETFWDVETGRVVMVTSKTKSTNRTSIYDYDEKGRLAYYSFDKLSESSRRKEPEIEIWFDYPESEPDGRYQITVKQRGTEKTRVITYNDRQKVNFNIFLELPMQGFYF